MISIVVLLAFCHSSASSRSTETASPAMASQEISFRSGQSTLRMRVVSVCSCLMSFFSLPSNNARIGRAMSTIIFLMVLCSAGLRPALSATTPPITSLLGDAFRSGEATVAITSPQPFYYLQVPISSALPSGPVTLTLSLVDYSQILYTTNNLIYYSIFENIPSSSNNTHAVFRVYIDSPTNTLRCKIKYLLCLTSIISTNFNILGNTFSPTATINAGSSIDYPFSNPLNTVGSWSYAIWYSGLNAYKSISTAFSLWIDFYTNSNRITIGVDVDSVVVSWFKFTLIFFNTQANSVSGYSLIYLKQFTPSTPSFSSSMASSGCWFDTTNILCGVNKFYFTSSAYDYTISLSDRMAYASSAMSYSTYWADIRCIVIAYKACPLAYSYYIDNSDTCTDNCNLGTLANYTCPGYPSNCLSCNSSTYCFQCKSNCYRGVDNLCYVCPPGQTPNNATYSCDICPMHCQICQMSTLTCTTCSSGYFKGIDSLCYSSCLIGTFPNAGNSTCDQCPTGCHSCNSSAFCNTCQVNNYKSSDHLCYAVCPSGTFANQATLTCDNCPTGCTACSSLSTCQQCLLGWAVQGGCTKTSGCLEVIYNQPEEVIGTCTSCSSSFTLVSSACQCSGGKVLAGQYCTSVIGCIAAASISGNVVCQFCDISGHFLLDHITNTCDCQSYYSIQGQQCKQICGDGVVISAQCDDGNIESGDGCSSNCSIEPKYRCSTNNSLSPTICQLISFDITASLDSIKREGEDNKAIFTFIFNPNLFNLKYINLNSFFSLNCEAILENIFWEYKQGKTTATVTFGSDLEGQEAAANFTFDQLYISHQPIVLNFTIHTQNIQLIHYESETIEQTKIIKNAFFGISCGALFLLFVGSWMHKMVGVELIHALQVVYYLHFTFKDYTLPLSSFQSLSLISLNDLYWQSQLQNFQGNSSFQKVPFSEDRTEFTLYFLAIPAFLSLFGLTVYLLTYKYAEIETTESVLKIIRRIYNGVIFPVTMGFLFPYFFAKTTLEMTTASSSSSKFPMELISFISLLIFALTSVVLSYEVKNLFISIRSEEDKKTFLFGLAKQYYVPSYCLYSIAMVILLSVQIRKGFSLSLIPIIAMSMLMILLLVKFRLYFKILDIVSTISNYFFELGFIVTLYLRNNEVIPSDKNTDLIICLGMAVFIMISILLSVARIILFLCSQREEEGGGSIVETSARKITKEKMKMIDNQQDQIKEMMMRNCSRDISKNQALLNNIVGHQNDPTTNKKITIDPELQIAKDKVLQTFKRNTKVQNRMIREYGENGI